MKLWSIVLIALSTSFSLAQMPPLCPEVTNAPPFTRVLKGKDGWLFRGVDFIGKEFTDTLTGNSQDYFAKFVKVLSAQGIELVVVAVPSHAMVYPQYLDTEQNDDQTSYDVQSAREGYQMFLDALASSGIVTPNLVNAALEKGEDKFFFKHDHHWTTWGSRVAADAVANHIKEQSAAYQSLEKKNIYISELVKTESLIGTYQKLVNDACNNLLPSESYPGEPREIYITKQSGILLETGLLDTTNYPIVLLGTSYSDPEYNFSGFLSEFLGVEVLNANVSAGGPITALETYLQSENYQIQKPSILVWEFPLYNPPQIIDDLMRLVPTTLGECLPEQSVRSNQEVNISQKQTLLLTDLQTLQLDQHYLTLELSDLTLTKFSLLFSYQDGTTKDIAVDRIVKETAPNSGKFFVELPSATQSLSNIVLEKLSEK